MRPHTGTSFKPEAANEPTTVFSSGYTMMKYLHRAGAELAGTPSGQASSCFGDIQPFTLRYSSVTGNVSHKRYADFPEGDPRGRAAAGRCVRVPGTREEELSREQ